MNLTKTTQFAALVLPALLFAQVGSAAQEGKAPSAAPPAPPVGVLEVHQQEVQLSRDLPARLVASSDVMVHARVTGIVQKQLFEEGSYVKAGQPLYQIDDRMFRANLSSAKAQLSQAQANLRQAQADVNRYASLIKSKAVSAQIYQQAQTQLAGAQAGVDMAKAAYDVAKLNVDYAHVTAPIDGYIGKALVGIGALVSAQQGTPLAHIQKLDPLYVDIKQPSSQVLATRKLLLAEGKKPHMQGLDITIKLEDGSLYEHKGKLKFADVGVDIGTGEASLRAEIPNPEHLLMAGLYVRAQVPQMEVANAVLIPQQAVTRGKVDTVFVLTPDNGYAPRPVHILQAHGNDWLVNGGLQEGEKVIVDGMQKVLMMRLPKVTPVPYGQPPAAGAPQKPQAAPQQ